MALRVLTVDDSKTIRMIVKKAFKPFDCDIFEAENGVDGLSLATREKPDLIVLDITMPIMNGIEMLEKMKKEAALKDIPVIMLTAESGRDNVMQIVKMGVKDYIVKPFKGEQLIERVKSIVQLTDRPETPAETVEPSKKFFYAKDGIQYLLLPEKVTRPTIAEIETHLHGVLKDMVGAGIARFILDISRVTEINVVLIKLIISAYSGCQKSNYRFRAVAGPQMIKELKGFQETGDIPMDQNIEAAVASL